MATRDEHQGNELARPLDGRIPGHQLHNVVSKQSETFNTGRPLGIRRAAERDRHSAVDESNRLRRVASEPAVGLESSRTIRPVGRPEDETGYSAQIRGRLASAQLRRRELDGSLHSPMQRTNPNVSSETQFALFNQNLHFS